VEEDFFQIKLDRSWINGADSKKALPEKSLKYLIFLVGVGGIEPPTN
jgi:hypothetical protein